MKTVRNTSITRKAIAGAITTAALAVALTGASSARAQETLIGLNTNNQIFSFNSSTPGSFSNLTSVTGLDLNFNLEDIDFRPTAVTPSLNGVLYGLGKSTVTGSTALRLYTIGTNGAVLSSIALTASTGGLNPTASPFANANYSIDFNPMANALRIVNDAGQNYRIGAANLATGVTFTDVAFNGVSPTTGILGAAYTNNFGGASATALYEVSYINPTDTLYQQTDANGGTLANRGSLGADLVLGGFDISGVTGNAYYGGGSSFYQINLATGAATTVGTFSSSVGNVRGIAAQIGTAAPEPGSLAFIGTGLLGMVGSFVRRRRQK